MIRPALCSGRDPVQARSAESFSCGRHVRHAQGSNAWEGWRFSTALRSHPIMDEHMLESLWQAFDRNRPLPIVDVGDRAPFARTTYAEVWTVPISGFFVTLRSWPVAGLLAAASRPVNVSPQFRAPRRVSTSRAASTAEHALQCAHDRRREFQVSYRTSDRVRAAELAPRLQRRFEKEGLLLFHLPQSPRDD